jgi:hypothetical protein
MSALEVELAGMRLGALSTRARTAGATPQEIEAAQDDDDSKRALIKLVLAKEVDPAEVLRGQLGALKLGALSRRAAAAGVAQGVLEAAQDEDEPRAAIIELIVRAETIPEGVPTAPPTEPGERALPCKIHTAHVQGLVYQETRVLL